jgi:uncharacterized protein (TIGR00251 family)
VTTAARVRLRVVPGAGANAIVGRHGDAWKIRVGAPAERGAANDALLRLLAEALGLGRRDVTLVSGHGARDKIVELAGLTPAEVERRLASAERKGFRR